MADGYRLDGYIDEAVNNRIYPIVVRLLKYVDREKLMREELSSPEVRKVMDKMDKLYNAGDVESIKALEDFSRELRQR
jgi:hypothetical protein